MRVVLHSRVGNVILGIVGSVYLVAGTALFVYYVWDSWGAAGLIDRGAQFALAACAVAGAWFLRTAVRNLGIHLQLRKTSADVHQTA